MVQQKKTFILWDNVSLLCDPIPLSLRERKMLHLWECKHRLLLQATEKNKNEIKTSYEMSKHFLTAPPLLRDFIYQEKISFFLDTPYEDWSKLSQIEVNYYTDLSLLKNDNYMYINHSAPHNFSTIQIKYSTPSWWCQTHIHKLTFKWFQESLFRLDSKFTHLKGTIAGGDWFFSSNSYCWFGSILIYHLLVSGYLVTFNSLSFSPNLHVTNLLVSEDTLVLVVSMQMRHISTAQGALRVTLTGFSLVMTTFTHTLPHRYRKK